MRILRDPVDREHERFDHPLVEAICVGFYGGFTYLIFDNLGPMLNWWIWDRSDITTWPYLNAVPLTSYFWFFSFTGAFALAGLVFVFHLRRPRVPRDRLLMIFPLV